MTSLESLARYISRPSLAIDALQQLQDGNLALETPPEPRVVDRILRHRESERCKTKDPFKPRAPPSTRSRQ